MINLTFPVTNTTTMEESVRSIREIREVNNSILTSLLSSAVEITD